MQNLTWFALKLQEFVQFYKADVVENHEVERKFRKMKYRFAERKILFPPLTMPAIPTLFITECKMVDEHSHRYSLLYLIACQNNHDNHTITSLHFEISSGQASIK